MDTQNAITVLISLASSIIGGGVVAFLNHYLARNKTEAEIRKLNAEAEKNLAEARKTVFDVESVSANVNLLPNSVSERTIYDGTKRYDPFDFRGVEGQFYSEAEKKHVGPRGLGSLSIEEGGVLNIRRENTEGRFEIWLLQYSYDGLEHSFIPKNELISGQRKLRVSCQAKVVGGEHSVRFVLKDHTTGLWLINEKVRVTRDSWTPINLYFRVSPTVDSILRIDDEDVSQAPSSLQIRNLILAERSS